ncbi:2-hydroxyacid dehydrogenase [Lysinibacillus sp. SGAir0095]|uniref:2-hydroxyacid dehydrogenase n=1 Tax=Lysinibacillus sp. SGAir0095 TaxID=2070463 RepID=UPI0010CD22DA|nr:NAD(P)-dependent oxidoreductase [Lysinibacillus sp. SGAir0095]QCR33828.1 hydroxyacid dehydrogenase [Lysinibacillus sp. SGAir0095]
MKVLVIGNENRYKKYMPDVEIIKEADITFCTIGTSEEELIRQGKTAQVLLVDAIAPVSKNLIENLPNLQLIHSEGVGYNAIDIHTAKERGIYVCNNKGVNAGAVAEQTILLMLGLLRKVATGDMSVREGNQLKTKEKAMIEGITELADCKIGLIGFGDIAKATAKRLNPFECEIYYYSRTRLPKEIEDEFRVTYMELHELATTCDIISIHVPVTEETTGMINQEFLKKMKRTAYLVNTARGEIVDNEAVRQALIDGEIQGAGFDTVYPEPTTKDNILVNLPDEAADKVLFSPHIGGITSSTFFRAHENIWSNVEAVMNDQRPNYVVNGVLKIRRG